MEEDKDIHNFLILFTFVNYIFSRSCFIKFSNKYSEETLPVKKKIQARLFDACAIRNNSYLERDPFAIMIILHECDIVTLVNYVGIHQVCNILDRARAY